MKEGSETHKKDKKQRGSCSSIPRFDFRSRTSSLPCLKHEVDYGVARGQRADEGAPWERADGQPPPLCYCHPAPPQPQGGSAWEILALPRACTSVCIEVCALNRPHAQTLDGTARP